MQLFWKLNRIKIEFFKIGIISAGLFIINNPSLANKLEDKFFIELAKAGEERANYSITYDPQYFSIPYPGGDVPADKGVCTDVIIRAYRKLGIDLQVLIHQDMKQNFKLYPRKWRLKKPDTNIDHRRVYNQMIFFERFGSTLPITKKSEDYKPGDIVVWKLGGNIPHIGLVTTKKVMASKKYKVVHNISVGPKIEDVIFAWKIIGHYRYQPLDNKPIPKGIKKLLLAYPEHIVAATHYAVIWSDGEIMAYDDGREKDFQSLLKTPDLEDQLQQVYKKGKIKKPTRNHDPGRIRFEPFFKKMYGETQKEVEQKLVKVIWLPQTAKKIIWVTSVNGVDKKIKAISKELEQRPDLLRYINNPAGGFVWRNIAGTSRLSTHSYGIAMDINIKQANYWKWDKKNNYENKIPQDIIDVFEKHGFIWGGKWYHYDTMHFEYRPELL